MRCEAGGGREPEPCLGPHLTQHLTRGLTSRVTYGAHLTQHLTWGLTSCVTYFGAFPNTLPVLGPHLTPYRGVNLN